MALKIDCVPPTLLGWVQRHEVDTGTRAGITTGGQQRMKDLERENNKLRRATEILKLASAFFAQEESVRRIRPANPS